MVLSYIRRKLLFLFVFTCLSLTGLLLLLSDNQEHQLISNVESPKKGYSLQTSAIPSHQTTGCKIPHLEPFDPSILHLLASPKTTFCDSRPPLTYTSGGFLYVNHTVRRQYYEKAAAVPNRTTVHCCYRTITRDNEGQTDNSFRYDPVCKEIEDKVEIKSEFLHVECFHGIRRVYSNFHATILIQQNVEDRSDIMEQLFRERHKKHDTLPNVLILGIDTVSRVNFHRFMKKTLNVLVQRMGAIEMTAYNKVRDNTFPNVIPLLTGIFAHELKSACWKNPQQAFDSCTFLWNKYVQHGYRTLFAEDAPHLGTFNYMRRGFRWSPTDYYLRPLMLAAQAFAHRKNNICMGNRVETQVILDWLLEFMRTFNGVPYFAFSWVASLTHDVPENAVLADNFYADFFDRALSDNLLNNTVVFFLSDHGRRWGKYRESYHGWYEDRLPFFFLVFPEWIKKQYPSFVRNVIANSGRLTTPFDVHETLKDLLTLWEVEQGMNSTPIYPSYPIRGISLLRKIPETRTCSDVSIPQHFCACQSFINASIRDPIIQHAVDHAVQHLNALLRDELKCAKLVLKAILDARKYNVTSQTYQQYLVVFKVLPSEGVFEATVKYIAKGNNDSPFKVSGEISRISAYGSESNCISDPYLKKYCYCSNWQALRWT